MTESSRVLAILITKADSAYCERTLASLFSQSLSPSRLLIGVIGDDASPIRSYCEATNIPFPYRVHSLGKPATFFEAVNALASECEDEDEWFWLLHDDSAPESHCLERLIDSVKETADTDTAAPIGIAGAKQVAWDNPNQLLEVGIRATRSARRVPDIDQSEYDQGQYDMRREVLAVGTAGMLVRRSALEEVGGFEDKLGPFGDGLELSRRMQAGGYEVIVCPHAKVRHAQQSLGEDERSSFAQRRKAQIFNALVGTPTLLFPVLFLAYLIGAFLRALARLFTGELRLAWAELRAPFALFTSLGSLFRARKRLRKASKNSARQPTNTHEERPRAIRSARRAHRCAHRDAAAMEDVLDPLTEKALQKRRQSARSYAWLILAITGVATIVAHLPRFAMQATGGALLPDSSSFGQGVRAVASSWLASGDGYAVPSDIFWGFLTPFSLVTSHLGVTATWTIFLAVIAAGLSAYIAAGDINLSPPVRAVGALVWAFAPPLLDSISAGHVAGALAHSVAPLAVMAYIRAWKGSASALAVSALLFSFLVTASPMILLLSIIAAIVGFIRHPKQRARWLALPIPALILLAPTLFALARLAFFPPSASASPLSKPWRLLFSTPGMPVDTQASPLSMLSFSPLSTTTFSQLATFDIGALVRTLPLGIILVIAIMALLRPSRYRAIRLGWLFIAAGWAWALVASSVSVGVLATPGEYTITHAWTGIALTCAFLGVWIVVLNMARTSSKEDVDDSPSGSDSPEGGRFRAKVRSFAHSFARAGVNSAVFVTAIASLVFGAVWVANSFTGSGSLLSPARSQAPALALADEESAYHSRVLALRGDENGFSSELWRGDGIQLHETSMLSSLIRTDIATAGEKSTPYGAQANEDLASAVASLSSDSSSVATTFAHHGVSVVLVPETTADSASRTLIGRLSSIADLEYITANETGSFWRVRTGETISTSVSRVRLEAGETSIAVPSGVFGVQVSLDEVRSELEKTVTTPTMGRVILAERADPYWHAELVTDKGSQPLKAVGDSWNQQWDIPLDTASADAELVIYYGSPIQRVWPYVQLAAVALCIIGAIALPKKKRERYE